MNSKFETLPQTDPETEKTIQKLADAAADYAIANTKKKRNVWKLISFVLFACICVKAVYFLLVVFGATSCPSAGQLFYRAPSGVSVSDLKPKTHSGRTKSGEKLVEMINNSDKWKWKAVMNEAYSRSRYGIMVDLSRFGDLESLLELASMPPNDFVPPESFDLREQYKGCSHLHQPTINQGRCGSCWVVAATSMLSDRICIATNQSVDIQLSATDVLTCSVPSNGCDGGHTSDAVEYMLENGVPTGGSYGSEEGCRPYEHDAACGSSPCTLMDYVNADNMECRKTCRKGYRKRYDEDKYQISAAYRLTSVERDQNLERIYKDENIAKDVRRVQYELMNKGPVVSCFMVYEDFLLYESGIYEQTKKTMKVYAHCARVIGWGEESGIGYWLVSNSWGRDWGEAGFFKIRMGSKNGVGFEDMFYALEPKI